MMSASSVAEASKKSLPDTKKRRDKIAKDLASLQSEYGRLRMMPSRMLDIEVVLEIMRSYFPNEDTTKAWAVLNGHPFPSLRALPSAGLRAIAITRQRLRQFSGREAWETALSEYQAIPEPYTLFRVSSTGVKYAESTLLRSERILYLSFALQNSPLRRTPNAQYAEPGIYRFADGRSMHEVELPVRAVDLASYTALDVAHRERAYRAPIRIKKDALIATAVWMDQNAPEKSAAWNQSWAARVDVLLQAVTKEGLQESDELVLDGLQHLLGMVGSGKSSLLTVLAVHLVRHGHTVTMVASDVATLLREQAVFDALQEHDSRLQAVPLVGRSTRQIHLQRLHISEALKHGATLEEQHPAFKNLSIFCPLDGLRQDVRPLSPGNEPCTRLQLVEDTDDGLVVHPGRHYCSLMPVCPIHYSTRTLDSAGIWLATPASLLAASPQVPLITEQMQFIELVMRASDVVLVDEADLMQVQFDDRFAPTETLVGDSDGILDRLASKVSRELYTPGRPLIGRRPDLDEWLTEHQKVQATVNRLYKWLREYPEVRQWLERTFFYGDRLLDKVGGDLERLGVDVTSYQSARDSYMNAPLPEHSEAYLLAGANMTESRPDSMQAAPAHAEWSVAVQDEIWHGQTGAAIKLLRKWMKSHLELPPTLSDVKLEATAQKLLFSLMVVVLDRALRSIIRNWPVAADELDIDRGTGALFYQPDESLVCLVPEPPMGPVFGFQYIDLDNSGRGTLRFFRVSGVGRSLLYHLHDAYRESHGLAGPHVLLTSGTSWAPGSWKYHLRIPPSMILLPKRNDHTAETYCTFEPLPDPERPDRALFASGKSGEDRVQSLRSMILALSDDRGLRPSRLDEELALLPESRRRILLVVGSYDEAQPVGELLSARTGRQDDVLILKRDPGGSAEDHWQTPKGYLLRSMLNQMPTYSARFLIAPLQAVERGHNILIGEEAAIGSVYFLIRPMPVPYDPLASVQKINAWAGEYVEGLTNMPATEAGTKLRTEAHLQWNRVMADNAHYGVNNLDAHAALLWTQLVLTWQCIGRLLRGGVPARVHFVDGKWAPARAGLVTGVSVDTEKTSMLLGFRNILRTALSDPNPAKRAVAQALYGSFAAALENLQGMSAGVANVAMDGLDSPSLMKEHIPNEEQTPESDDEYLDIVEEEF